MTGAAAVFVGAEPPQITLVPSTSAVSGSSNATGAANITTASVVVTPSGGIAPYTHAWTQTSSSALTWTIGAASAATTSFTAQSVPEGTSDSVIFQDTVTDAVGNKAAVSVSATARHFSGGTL